MSVPAVAPPAATSPSAPDAADAVLVQRVLAPLWSAGAGWWILFAIAAAGTLLLGVGVTYSVAVGIGVWGNNIPVAWAFSPAIT